MDLDQIIKEMDEADRLNRQILNPLGDIPVTRLVPDNFITPHFSAFDSVKADESLRAIWVNTQHLEAQMRAALAPWYEVRPSLQLKVAELYDAMRPMRDAAAAAMKDAERIYDAMQPLRDAVRNIQQHYEVLGPLQPTGRLLQEIYSSQLVFSTDQITRLVSESDLLSATSAFGLNGPDLSHALSLLPELHQGWLSAIGRFSGPTLDFLGPTISIPSREVLRSIEETRVVIGEDEEGEAIERPSLPELEDLIAAVSVDLLPTYRGAMKRLDEVGDDYQRQAVVSMRIFVQALLTRLASNEAAAKYLMAVEGKELKGDPSWSLRVETAYASLGQPELTNTMKSRAKIMMLNMEVLQKTIHDLPELHSHDQLQHFFNNVLATVRNILEVFHLVRHKR
jgi:hypothetical protein